MIESVAGGKALPQEVVKEIVIKTDGVPLFVEELTKAVLELNLVRGERRAICVLRSVATTCDPGDAC